MAASTSIPAALSSAGARYGADGLAATFAVESTAPSPPQAGEPRATAVTMHGRTTVLPRVIVSDAGAGWSVDSRPRYDLLKGLGEGGMGEVALMHDHDIERAVAVKKLRADLQNTTALLRFAEEIKIIGQLEHPNIIPVHDVGIDEAGQHYFVMKYVRGETLEQVIERLRAGDPAYTRRFTFEHRTQVFLAILQAVRYAHAQGIIHRDIKPANIMVGPYGEVTVMDWGLAKQVRGRDGAPFAQPGATAARGVEVPAAPTTGDRKKLVETHHGALLGTPLYMSPEQAAGRIDELDERSDIYSLGVLFHELIVLEHYLDDLDELPAVLAAVVSPEPSRRSHFGYLLARGVPAELVHFLVKALEKDRARRFQSVDEMAARLEAITNGEIAVQCHVTAVKHYNSRLFKWVDRHPFAFTAALSLAAVAVLYGVVMAVVRLAHLAGVG